MAEETPGAPASEATVEAGTKGARFAATDAVRRLRRLIDDCRERASTDSEVLEDVELLADELARLYHV